jgi:CRISPR-associated protein Csd2
MAKNTQMELINTETESQVTALEDRYDIIYYVRARYCNPNGDPDMDNQPRVDPYTNHGLMSPQSLKRRIRDQVERIVAAIQFNKLSFNGELGDNLANALSPDLSDDSRGYNIYCQTSSNLKVMEQLGVALHFKAGGDIKKTPRDKLLSRYFYDVRAFGTVITKSSGEDDESGGQVVGPVQVSFGVSLKPVDILKITCTGPSREDPGIKGLDQITDPDRLREEQRKLQEKNTGKIRTMGRGYVVNDAIYRFQISVSPFQAANTGFNGTDLALLLVALKRWPDWYKTSSKTGMEHIAALVFRHSSKYGNMPIWEIQEKLDATLEEMGTTIDQADPKTLAEKLEEKLGGSIEVFIV